MSVLLDFYYHPTPNSAKVALMLEELAIPYKIYPVDISRGEQHSADFVKLNPNRKLPVIVDGDIAIFDSTAILLHLAQKTGRYLGEANEPTQAGMLSWLMLIASGFGPFTGQAIHFKHYAPAGQDYAAHRYNFEAERHWAIVNARLSGQRYLVGDEYSIADISLWGLVPRVAVPDGRSGMDAVSACGAAVPRNQRPPCRTTGSTARKPPRFQTRNR